MIIKITKSKNKKYIIKQHKNGKFCVEVRPLSRIKFFRELLNDALGNTHKHPEFLTSFYMSSLNSIDNLINIHIEKLGG